MLAHDHPGLNRVPQDLRNPGAALGDRPAGTALPGGRPPACRKSGWRSWAEQRCWVDRGVPRVGLAPSCSASLASLVPEGPGCSP